MSGIKKLYSWFLVWRSIPCILVYLSLRKSTRKRIDEDIVRYGFTGGIIGLHQGMVFNPLFRRQFYTRVLYESTTKYYFCRWTYKPLDSFAIETTQSSIGGGMMAYHGGSTIVFCHSIGDHFTVYQNVTLGRGKMIDGNDVPIIGNNVTVYTGAVVIGGIHVGDNAVIGAGAVVVKDVPANTVVVGAPSRYILQKQNRRKSME